MRNAKRSSRRTWVLAAVLAFGALAAVSGAEVGRAQAPGEEEGSRILLPMAVRGLGRDELRPAPTLRATAPPTEPPATATASPTPSPEPSPTEPPTPTTPAETGAIQGRMTVSGVPLDIGFGVPGTPQIELRRRAGSGDWELVANAEIVDEEGRYFFENPPALAEGEVYQVWWVNPPGLGADLWMGRWWSRDIPAFGSGEDVDLGVFELADLKMTDPCHDCGQTPPIEFKWQPREHASERYRWAVFSGCDQDVSQRATAWLSADLGRASSYETGPPAGFRLDTRYCWYVRVDDGENGGGWPFYARRVTWLASADRGRPEIGFD